MAFLNVYSPSMDDNLTKIYYELQSPQSMKNFRRRHEDTKKHWTQMDTEKTGLNLLGFQHDEYESKEFLFSELTQ
jgi:hypothetical protein